MDETWTGLKSSPLRLLFTILGVAIGIFAVVVMSSMAFHFQLLAQRFQSYIQDKAFIREKTGFFGGGAISDKKLLALEKIEGIEKVVPLLISRLRAKELFVFGLPDILFALPVQDMKVLFRQTRMIAGKWPEEEESFQCVAGAEIASSYHLSVGSDFPFRDKSFKVVGILERSEGPEDKQLIIPLKTAQKVLKRGALVSYGILILKDNFPEEKVIRSIEKQDTELEVITSMHLKKQIRQKVILWNAITLGCAFLAVIIGGLSIINTMFTSVIERVREIGIKKAIGASDWDILLEFLQQAIFISLAGGILGTITGLIFTWLFNLWLRTKGMILFEISFSLIVLIIFLAMLIGILGGIFPAYKAAKLSPVDALRR